MRKFIIPLGLTMIGAAIIVVAALGATKNERRIVPTPKAGAPAPRPNPPGTIDGAVTPGLISDSVAYSLFFNFVAEHRTANKRSALNSYIRQGVLNGIDADALIKTADEFREAYKAIDEKERALTTTHERGSTTDARLAEFKQRKTALVNEKVLLLSNRLGKDSAEKVRLHVTEYIKRKVKILPSMVNAPIAR